MKDFRFTLIAACFLGLMLIGHCAKAEESDRDNMVERSVMCWHLNTTFAAASRVEGRDDDFFEFLSEIKRWYTVMNALEVTDIEFAASIGVNTLFLIDDEVTAGDLIRVYSENCE